MPPRQKTVIDNDPVTIVRLDPVDKGDFVNVVIGGQSRHKGAEVLEVRDTGILIRTDINGLTRAEISYIPWSAIEGLGLIGKR